MKKTLGSFLFGAILLAASPSLADVLNFHADMKGSAEVPATTSPGTGTLDASYDTSSKALSYTATYQGLTGAATAAHFHGPADATQAAGVVVPVAGTGFATPIKGSATLTDAQAADLQAGKWYFNIHTAANPNGEIRGQVMKK